jgi:hypothetical protein
VRCLAGPQAFVVGSGPVAFARDGVADNGVNPWLAAAVQGAVTDWINRGCNTGRCRKRQAAVTTPF